MPLKLKLTLVNSPRLRAIKRLSSTTSLKTFRISETKLFPLNRWLESSGHLINVGFFFFSNQVWGRWSEREKYKEFVSYIVFNRGRGECAKSLKTISWFIKYFHTLFLLNLIVKQWRSPSTDEERISESLVTHRIHMTHWWSFLLFHSSLYNSEFSMITT